MLMPVWIIFNRSVGENPTKEELQDMINWIDKDASGIVKFPDFLYMMASKVETLYNIIDFIIGRSNSNCNLSLTKERWGLIYGQNHLFELKKSTILI